ncbi:hypothetical protein Q3G72_017548 [Acer saccharum]|nr:hypothetical protein Q3G72_017548 [Acer saccharum]
MKKMVDLVGVSGLRRRWWKVKKMVEGEEEDAGGAGEVVVVFVPASFSTDRRWWGGWEGEEDGGFGWGFGWGWGWGWGFWVAKKMKKMVDLVGVSGLRRRWWKVKKMVEGEEEDADWISTVLLMRWTVEIQSGSLPKIIV